jgi:formylglycine-generating enzyme required for sulfatase activity
MFLAVTLPSCSKSPTAPNDPPPWLQPNIIMVETHPGGLNVPWTLTAPAGAVTNGNGDLKLLDQAAGAHTIVWGEVRGWVTPSPAHETKTLALNGSLVFSGTYVHRAGTISVHPTPIAAGARWQLAGPSGFMVSGDGDSTIADLNVGDYTVTWGSVPNWESPNPVEETKTLVADGAISFTGQYVHQVGTITINPDPNGINAAWQVAGPGGFNIVGDGDSTITEAALGDYTLTWGPVAGWTRPIPTATTRALTLGDVLTFSGTYLVDTGIPEGFAAIPAGAFTMGSPTNEAGRGAVEVQHQVTLTHSIYVQAAEVTNRQFVDLVQWAYGQGLVSATSARILDNLDTSTAILMEMSSGDAEISFGNGLFTCLNPDHPVKYVSWYGAAAYCDWLSLRSGLPRAYDHATWACNGNNPFGAAGYRLPTEAEWEYACRAGSATAFANGPIMYPVNCSPLDPNLNQVGWYCGNAGSWSLPVVQRGPNAWHIYDMHGNVAEWCNDWYAAYDGAATDPTGPIGGAERVFRGGSWDAFARNCRSAPRYSRAPGTTETTVGLRPVQSAN